MGQILKKHIQTKDELYQNLLSSNNGHTQSLIVSTNQNVDEQQQHTMYGKLEKQMMLNKPEEKQSPKWYEKVLFTPESTFIIIIKCVTLVLIYLYFLQIPITISFKNHRQNSQLFFEVINIPAIITFILTVFIKLKTAFYHEGILISDQRQVLMNYLINMAIFDAISITSIIIYEATMIASDESSEDLRYNIRYIVILFFLKIPEVIATEQSIIASLDLKRNVKAGLKLILLLTKIFMLCNVAACCFFFISDNLCPLENHMCTDCCWVQQVEIMGQALKNGDWTLQYMFSLYWASTTMLTIGYGDITPENEAEVVYTVTAQFISCILFAFSINEVWSIIQQRNSKTNKIHFRLNIINVYMRDKNVSSNLKSRVNSYLSNFYHNKNLREKQLQSEIISELTPSLRNELCFESYGCVFKNQPFFRNFSDQFLETASGCIREVGFFEEEPIYEPHAESKISLYYIIKGQIVSFVELGHSHTQNISLEYYQKDSTLGLFEFVRQLNYCHSLKAVKYSLLYVLDYENWISAILEFEEDCQKFFKIKHRAQFNNHIKKLQIKCTICNSNKHQSDMCLQAAIECFSLNFLDRYLGEAGRRAYPRHSFKPFISTDVRTHHIVFEPTINTKSLKVLRKASFPVTKKQLARPHPQSHKKVIVHQHAHHEKMKKIILRKKLKEEFTQESKDYAELVTSILMRIETVQNYEFYWHEMNASDIGWMKEKRRLSYNKMIIT